MGLFKSDYQEGQEDGKRLRESDGPTTQRAISDFVDTIFGADEHRAGVADTFDDDDDD